MNLFPLRVPPGADLRKAVEDCLKAQGQVAAFVMRRSAAECERQAVEQRHVPNIEEASMFDHVGFGVTNIARSKAFFLEALRPLGVAVVMEGPYGVGMGRNGKPSLWLFETKEVPARLHIAFAAGSRAEVDAFHRAALAAGGQDNGEPGLRPHYHPNYYGAFVLGPDGHNLEAVCHAPE